MGPGKVGSEVDRFLNRRDSFIDFALGGDDQPEVVVVFGNVRVNRDRPPDERRPPRQVRETTR